VKNTEEDNLKCIFYLIPFSDSILPLHCAFGFSSAVARMKIKRTNTTKVDLISGFIAPPIKQRIYYTTN